MKEKIEKIITDEKFKEFLFKKAKDSMLDFDGDILYYNGEKYFIDINQDLCIKCESQKEDN